MGVSIGCVVEGHADRESVPIVIRRIANAIDHTIDLNVPPPIRIPKSKLLKQGELERAVEMASRKIGGQGAVLVVLDSDEDCPAVLGPDLLQRVVVKIGHLPAAIVLAKVEFESWFLAAAESLRGRRGLSENLQSPPDPEAVRGAKEWLEQRMEEGWSYVPTLDQPAFAAQFDFEMARRADSFDKCYREIVRLVTCQLPHTDGTPG